MNSAANAGIAHVEESLGAIDILVNNAGMQFRTTLEDFPLAKWRELMQVNVESAFIVSKAVAKGMIARKAGQDHQHQFCAE